MKEKDKISLIDSLSFFIVYYITLNFLRLISTLLYKGNLKKSPYHIQISA